MGWEYEVTELSEGIVATVYDDKSRMVADYLSEENARLIAAAPDLLAVLKALAEDRRIALGSIHRKRISAVITKAEAAP